MQQGTTKRRRHAGRLIALSVLGWALFARDADDREHEGPAATEHSSFDLDEVSWDLPAAPADVRRRGMARASESKRPRRRFAATLVFAALFFAGAALSAGAGNKVANGIEGGTDTATTETDQSVEAKAESSDDATSQSTETVPPTETDPTPTDDNSTGSEDPGTSTEPVEDPGDPADGGNDGSSLELEEHETVPDETGEGSSGGGDSSGGAPAAPTSDGAQTHGGQSNSSGSGSSGGGATDSLPGQPVFDPEPSPSQTLPPDPEVATVGTAATIWLHRTLPDPTPLARRLTPRFADMLRRESRRAHADWSLVLGVIRVDGSYGRVPASRAHVSSVARHLHATGARESQWRAALSLRGRTAFADRAVAYARYARVAGLRALVVGLRAAKPKLERAFLRDSRLHVYAGGRDDVAAHRIDVRVLVVIRYLAEQFGEVTVSCLRAGHGLYARPGVISAHIYGQAVDIAALGGVSIIGHQQASSVTARAVRGVLLLPREMQARQVISLIAMGGPSFALSNHDDHIHIGY